MVMERRGSMGVESGKASGGGSGKEEMDEWDLGDLKKRERRKKKKKGKKKNKENERTKGRENVVIVVHDDDDDEVSGDDVAKRTGCWLKLRFTGSCMGWRSKVDSSVSNTSNYGNAMNP